MRPVTPGAIMSLVEMFLRPPQGTRRRRRPVVRARPRNPKERKVLSIHVDEDYVFREQVSGELGELRGEVGEMRGDIHGINRLLWFIATLMAAGMGFDVTGLVPH